MVDLSHAAPAAVVQPRSTPTSIWMHSARFDLLCFVASTAIVFGPWIADQYYQVSSKHILLAVGAVANGPHLIATWTRVYLDGNERWQRPFVYYVIPAVFAAFVVLMVVTEGTHSSLLRTVLFYWAVWHFVSQNWGILRIYQRKAGEADLGIAKLERAVLYLGAAWPVAWRVVNGPHEMFGAAIYVPPLPASTPDAVGVAFFTAALFYGALRLRQRLSGAQVDFMRPLFLTSSAIGFFVPFMLITSRGSVSFAAAAAWHGLQYVAIVWLFNRRKWAGKIDPKARLVSWASQEGRGPLFFLMLLGVGGVAYGIVILFALLMTWDIRVTATTTWLSFTFGHYFIDGMIWKLRKPQVSQQLV